MSKDFDILSYLMGKQDGGGGGGGGDITVESKSIDANGTYTAPSGKAYSPVVVDVPNTYAAGDEGKVVSNGALVAQTAHAEVTQNGTIDTTLNNSVTVNVSGASLPAQYTEYEVMAASAASSMLGCCNVIMTGITRKANHLYGISLYGKSRSSWVSNQFISVVFVGSANWGTGIRYRDGNFGSTAIGNQYDGAIEVGDTFIVIDMDYTD